MRHIDLPDSISNLVDHLKVVQLTWQGIPVQLPKFAVYAVVQQPVLDSYFYRNGKRMGLVKFGRYQVPVIDPFKGNIDSPPANIVIISHSKGNRFGLYAYPADSIEKDISLPVSHRSVKRIIKHFL